MKNKLVILFFLFTSISLHSEVARASGKNNPGFVLFPLEIASPNGKLNFNLAYSSVDGLVYSFSANSRILIKKSKLGLTSIGTGLPVKALRRSVNAVWKPVWGKRKIVPEIYNELTLDFNSYKIVVRAYDDGIAFRYSFKREQAPEELTQFNFNGDYTAWYYNGENANIGPEKLSDCNDKRLPVMTIKVDDNNYLAIHEASLSYGEPLILNSEKKQTIFTIASRPNDAWKVIMYGTTPGQMVDSHLLELLNPPPSKNMDFSWVKPGVAVWDWRIAGAQVDDFKYEMSLPSWKRMVDFAAGNNIRYLALDADWYGPEFGPNSDPIKGGKVVQVHQIIKYAETKHVGIWLYLNDVGGRRFPIESTLKQYRDWGAAGIKYGFMSGSPAEKNERTRMITELCAKYHLLCDFHDGPVHPYGQMRTYPNAVKREY